MNNLSSFGQLTSIQTAEFKNFKEDSLGNISLHTVPANELKIVGDNLIYKGRKMFLESKKPFLKLLGEASLNKIAKATNPQVIDSLVNAFLKTNKSNVSLRFDANKNLTAVKMVANSVSPEKYFRLVDHVLNTYSGLEIDQMSQDTKGGLGISFRTNQEIGIVGDEIFKGGFTLAWDGAVEFNPYMLRLFCTNGMRFKEKSERNILESTHTQAWDNFLGTIANSAGQNFMPMNFVTNVKKAIDVNASLSEIKFAHNLLKNAVGDDASVFNIDGTNWSFDQIYASFERAGVPMISLSSAQEKNLRGPVTVMNLVNELSDIASHDLFDVESGTREKLRIQAGSLLSKEQLDTEALMFQVF